MNLKLWPGDYQFVDAKGRHGGFGPDGNFRSRNSTTQNKRYIFVFRIPLPSQDKGRERYANSILSDHTKQSLDALPHQNKIRIPETPRQCLIAKDAKLNVITESGLQPRLHDLFDHLPESFNCPLYRSRPSDAFGSPRRYIIPITAAPDKVVFWSDGEMGPAYGGGARAPNLWRLWAPVLFQRPFRVVCYC